MGDPLATIEELLPGEGTFDDSGIIRAARIGTYEIDTRDMKCVVKPATRVPAFLHEGDRVYGVIEMLKPVMAGVRVLCVEGNARMVAGDTNGTLHVSKVAKRYVQDVGREYRLGDIVRAKVIDTKPSIQLSTDERDCGTIIALCLRDRFPLQKAGKGLECPNCGRQEMRNLAPDYGRVEVPARVALMVGA